LAVKRKVIAGGLVVLLCVSVLVLLIGCGGSDDEEEGGDVVPLGTMRHYVGGEQWQYNVTGTFVSGTGLTTALTPAVATLTYSADTTTVGGTVSHTMTLTIPLAYPGYNETETFKIALTQDVDGNLALTGIDANANLLEPLIEPFALPGPSSFGHDWSSAADVTAYGLLEATTKYKGTENVPTGGRTYECYKYEGTKALAGFETTLNAWLNPQVGSFVKLNHIYPDSGGTLNATLSLTSGPS
jgi:hypothetical protein